MEASTINTDADRVKYKVAFDINPHAGHQSKAATSAMLQVTANGWDTALLCVYLLYFFVIGACCHIIPSVYIVD